MATNNEKPDFVQESLSTGERLIYKGRFHWVYTVQAALNILWGLIACVILLDVGTMGEQGGLLYRIQSANGGLRVAAFVLLLLGILQFIRLMLIKATTEVAITSSRVVYKRGIISRSIGELSTDRIEGTEIVQTIPGRMLGYGHVVVHGIGIGRVNMPILADPIGLDRAIREARRA